MEYILSNCFLTRDFDQRVTDGRHCRSWHPNYYSINTRWWFRKPTVTFGFLNYMESINQSIDRSINQNYTSITLSSCSGKLFTADFIKILYTYAENGQLILENQTCFLRDLSILDHIFFILTLIKLLKRECAFLYFSKGLTRFEPLVYGAKSLLV